MKLRTLLIAFVMTVSAATPALAQGQPVSPGWKIYTYAPSGRTLKSHQADTTPTGLAAFTFLATPDDAVLATQRPNGPHSSILGKTIHAVIAVDAATGTTFASYGEGTPHNPCGTPASVRFYFTTNGAFGFGTDNDWYSKYWWSNGAGSVALKDAAGQTVELTAKIDIGHWSNWNGKVATERPDGFTAAATNPDLIGFSFGGGCFFENGVGTPKGNATFTVISFDIED